MTTVSQSAQLESLRTAASKDSIQQGALDQCLLDRAAELIRNGESDSAEPILTDLVERDGPLPGALDLKARLCVRSGRFSEAEQLWERVLAKEPNHAVAREALVRLRSLQRRAVWFQPMRLVAIFAAGCALLLAPWFWLAWETGRQARSLHGDMAMMRNELALRQREARELEGENLQRHREVAESVNSVLSLAKSVAERSTALADAQRRAEARFTELADSEKEREKRQSKMDETLRALSQSTSALSLTLEQNNKSDDEAFAALQSKLAEDLSARSETRPSGSPLPVPLFHLDGVAVSGEAATQTIAFKRDLFDHDGKLTAEIKPILASVAAALAALPKAASIEFVADFDPGLPNGRTEAISRLAQMFDAFASANQPAVEAAFRVVPVDQAKAEEPKGCRILVSSPHP